MRASSALLARQAHLDGDGPWSGPVLWTRAELARNLETCPFPHAADDDERRRSAGELRAAAATLPSLAGRPFVAVADLDPAERELAAESGLVSRSLAEAAGAGALAAVSEDGALAVRIHDGDHLRLVARRSGLDPVAALRDVLGAERGLDRVLTFAYDDRFGYLCSEPARTGTGLTLSCLLHLPALAHAGSLADALNDLGETGLVARARHEHEGRAAGHLFRVRTRTTLGASEKSATAAFARAVAEVVGKEVALREILLGTVPEEIEDLVHRARGLLLHARRMSLAEALDRLSAARLGVETGLVAGPPTGAWNRVLLEILPTHLSAGDPEADRPALRAARLREFLG